MRFGAACSENVNIVRTLRGSVYKLLRAPPLRREDTPATPDGRSTGNEPQAQVAFAQWFNRLRCARHAHTPAGPCHPNILTLGTRSPFRQVRRGPDTAPS